VTPAALSAAIVTKKVSAAPSFDGYFQRVNPAWERTFGYSRQELLARPFIEFVHPDDREATAAAAAQLVNADADVVDFRNRHRAKDGTYRCIEWNACAAQSERLIYAAARDVTDRLRAEEAREEAEERFRTAFEGVPIGMGLVGLDGRWLQVNQALCQLPGYTRQELLSKGFQEITHPEDLQGDAEHARKLRDGDQVLSDREAVHPCRWAPGLGFLQGLARSSYPRTPALSHHPGRRHQRA
jgi:PAS domain S-box-containing protein